MKSLNVFGRQHNYYMLFEAERDLKILTDLNNLISKPQILCYSGLEVINFYIFNDEHFIGNDCVRWLFKQLKTDNTEKDMRQCILDNCDENHDETKRLNEKYNGIYYRSVSFKPTIQIMITEKISEFQNALEALISDWEKENEQFKAEQKAYSLKFTISTVYKKTMPKGGEDGVDGYFDADITDSNTNTIRFVARNVFDFGFYTYPKRLEGTQKIFEKNEWTPEEIEISKWLKTFSPFTTEIRM